MSNRSSGGTSSFVVPFLFAFVLLKAAGHVYTSTWSWGWVLLPAVPVWATILHHFGIV